jgi:hypothetical protein
MLTQESVVLLLAASLPALIAAIFGVLNRKAISEVHLAINSRFDEFLHLAKTSSYAEGVKSAETAALDKATSFTEGVKASSFAEGVKSAEDKVKEGGNL